jgi:amphi-Trp domain-containing protein
MGKEIVLFSSEEKKDLKSVAAFLHQLADKLAENRVIFRQGTEEIVVEIPNNVVLEIKVEEELKKKKTQQSVEIEIEWYVGEEYPASLELG